jgi:hypothetical protein
MCAFAIQNIVVLFQLKEDFHFKISLNQCSQTRHNLKKYLQSKPDWNWPFFLKPAFCIIYKIVLVFSLRPHG